jgi:hypothetical protein
MGGPEAVAELDPIIGLHLPERSRGARVVTTGMLCLMVPVIF